MHEYARPGTVFVYTAVLVMRPFVTRYGTLSKWPGTSDFSGLPAANAPPS